MKEVALESLDPRLQKQVQNASKAISKNPVYAVDILSNIIQRHPGCLEVRRDLRKAQQRATQNKSGGLSGLMSKVSGFGRSFRAPKVEKDPQKALEAAEEMLCSNPGNIAAHELLGEAAQALELNETAAFAYEEIYRIEPANTENVKALMEAYILIGKNEEAIRIGEAAYRANPNDDGIQMLVKKASVEQTVDKGRWNEDESFRDKLKDEDEAQKLEQASRAKTGDAGLRSLIKDALEAVEAESENINLYRDIASNYRKLGEFDNALEWINKARQLDGGKADVNLERTASALQREKMQAAIQAQEAILEKDPENLDAKAALESIRGEAHAMQREQSEHLVQRYPNEFSYRYELGEIYLKDNEIDAAIKELQLAQRSPKVRVQALILLGKAYKQKGFFDLAIEQFGSAKREISGVTDAKKDVLYELGKCYELQGNMDKAIAEYKILYAADIAFRDVAQKIDDFYSKKNG
ncbi:MAG: Lipopolysaccharide assembly protein B [Opitutia bacterium UBA7350]|nr:MAG: Lipopolysaccharide assembly protein B [Opitutae bacterium UBA7350]